MTKGAVPREVAATTENITALQSAGYTLVNDNGQRLYCRTEKKTGSRLQTSTTCLTEQEAIQLEAVTRQTMTDVTRNVPPPAGK